MKLQARIIGLGLLLTGVPIGQVSGQRNPNLAAAQQANEFDMQGHAARAKTLLGQAYNEIGDAARPADQR